MRFLLLVFTLAQLAVKAQTHDAWIYFTDKPNASTYFANPNLMLSQRAIERRSNQGILLDIKDVPIYQNYIDQILSISGIVYKAKSKWMNCIHVQGNLPIIQSLENLAFVDSIEYADKNLNNNGKLIIPEVSKVKNKFEVNTDYNYGSAANQIELHHGNFLHQNNFTGNGIHIAVLDAGFINVNTANGFQRLFSNNQILGTYNFVDRIENVYTRHNHGTLVLSTMGGYIQNQYVGTAPDASYYMFITEDVTQEHPYEESLWVEAAEKADSLGVDVLNTSLGYTTYDNPNYNHQYAELDGQTAFMTRGAEIAFSRGMLVFNSAGNSGNSAWHYIGVPGDAPSIITVGATNALGQMAIFSSWGPTADGRIKPDVSVQGQSVAVITTSNNIVLGSGTSFSSPILAGSAACLWQAFPNKTNVEIAQAIRTSAHLYANPHNQYGYGIPNFQTAYNTLYADSYATSKFEIYPNPLKRDGILNVHINENLLNTELIIMDIQGKMIEKIVLNSHQNFLKLDKLDQGVYLVRLESIENVFLKKLIIQ